MTYEKNSPQTAFLNPDCYATSSGIELCVIVPTFNERDNVQELVHRLASCLGELRWEVIFVDDDSPDGTAAFVRAPKTPTSSCDYCDLAVDQHGSSPFRLAWIRNGAPAAMPTILLQSVIGVHPETSPWAVCTLFKSGA
jgi:glycosyl transferase family 2